MKIIGITGGIGSGKSTACKIFSALGVPVFYADDEAKKIYDDANVKSAVVALLGADAYSGNKLDRVYVAKKVFSDPKLLEKLNVIIHPAVQQSFKVWCEKNKNADYVIKEAAILFESGSDKETAQVILVTAPRQLKIERIMKRENISAEDVEKRMKNQWTDEEKIKSSAFLIRNDEEEALIPQVIKIHNALIGNKNSNV